MICPICKNEYREGITICHDCKVPLVDDLTNGPAPVIYGPREQLEEILAFCESKNMKTGFITYNEECDSTQLYFEGDEIDLGTRYVRTYIRRKNAEKLAIEAGIDPAELTPQLARQLELAKEKEIQDQRRKEQDRNKLYVDKRAKAEDYRSSGIVLVLVGGLGLAALIALYIGAVPGFENLRKNYMFLGVMGVLFLAFVIGGAFSFSKVDGILRQAARDEDLLERMAAKMKVLLTEETIQNALAAKFDLSKMSEAEIYFKRAQYMEDVIRDYFPDAETVMVEKIMDERYSDIYDEDDDN